MNEARQIDECLSVREGRLFIEERDTAQLVEEFGSPLFVFSESQLRRNVRRFRRAFAQRWPGGAVDVLPAIKANWIPAIRSILSDEGAGCDVYSAGELDCALRSGVDPGKVSVNGGGKSDEHVATCVESGVRITVEDVDEIDLIERVAARLGRKAKVRLRLKPELPNLWRPSDFAVELVPIDLGVQVYKNGIPTEHVIEIGRRALGMKHVDLTGLHVHLGRHHASPAFWRGAMRQYARLVGELRSAWGGWVPQELDVGGGIPTPRDPFARVLSRLDVPLFAVLWSIALVLRLVGNRARYRVLSALLERFAKKRPKETGGWTIEAYAEAIAGSLAVELQRRGVDPAKITLQVEPGRGLHGDTGVHLATVLEVKRQTRPIAWRWVLLDTTCFFLAGGVLENNLHAFVLANKAGEPARYTADVVGRSCFADRILPEVRVPDVQPGDVLAFLDAGAYQEVSASNFNALPRPASVLVNGAGAEIIRRAETLEDVFRRDVVPERLRAGRRSGSMQRAV